MEEKTVLAIDPGTSKCGMALLQRDAEGELELLWHLVPSRETAIDALELAAQVHPYSLIIVGSGTASRPLVSEIRNVKPGIGILVVDEKDTTQQARERYWENRKRRGWRRLLPASLQVPPEPFDDFVAMILAERVLGV